MEPNDASKRSRRSFTFRLSFGKPPPGVPSDADLTAEPESASAGVVAGPETQWEKTFELDPAGRRAKDKSPEDEQWERLRNLGHAYPDTARIHNILNIITWVIALSLPIATFVLTIASGEPQESVFFFTLGAVIVGVMVKSSIR